MRNQITNLIFALIIFLTLIAAGSVRGREKKVITPEWIFSDEADDITAVPAFKWLDNGKLLLYDKRIEKSRRTFELLDPRSGRRKSVLDMGQALVSIRSFLKDMDTLSVLPWPDACDDQAGYAVYLFNDDIFLLNFSSAAFHRITQTKSEEKSIRFSPNGRYFCFIRDNDLYLYDIQAETERHLTMNGSDTLLNGTLPWLYWEEIFNREDDGYWWSGDSRWIAFLQTNQAQVDTMYYVTFKDFHADLQKQFYPRAGDTNPIVRLGILSVDNPEIVWADLPKESFEYIVNVTWLPRNSKLAVETMNRTQEVLDLFLVDKITGSAEHVLKETDSAWVHQAQPYFLSNEKHFLWLSERDGFAHLYHYMNAGSLTKRVTGGLWAVLPSLSFIHNGQNAPFAVDEEHNLVYFMATEKSPVERHLYRAKLDGSSFQRISHDAGSHKVSFSPDLHYYVDEYSGLSTLPGLYLYRSDGTLVSTLAPPRPELLAPYAMRYPEIMTYPTSDGLSLPCMITKPAGFDPAKKYPIILHVYGGPALPIVVDAWDEILLTDQTLLNKGYLLAAFDNRSSAITAESQSSSIKKHLLGEVELRDLADFVKWLKKQPYVDPERLGIYGWSGGGTYTLLAMTRTTDFKAGIAGAPVTDWHYYDTKYTEAYMREPKDNSDGYKSTSLVDRASDLHGRLLIMHGAADDNVHIQNTWDFSNKLISEGKTFEMMIYPSCKHNFEDRKAKIHRQKTMVEFWSKNL